MKTNGRITNRPALLKTKVSTWRCRIRHLTLGNAIQFVYDEPEATDDFCSDPDSDSMQSSSVENHARTGHTDW